MSGLAMPAGDPAQLEQLADALEHHAADVGDLAGTTRVVTAQVRSDAAWNGPAATAYSQFTAALSRSMDREPPPLVQIAGAVRGYASALRAAQQQVTAYNTTVQQAQGSSGSPAVLLAVQTAGTNAAQACADCQAAGDQAAAQVKDSSGKAGDIFAPEGALRGTIEKIHTVLGAGGVDGVLWQLGKGAEQAEKFMEDLPKQESEWLKAGLPWGKDASQEEWDTAVRRWWAKSDAAEAFGEDFEDATQTLGMVSRIGRLVGGPVALAGDISTIINPSQAGAAGWVDRGMAFTNAGLVGADTVGAAGALLGIDALSFSIPPVGVALAVGTGLYLASSYAYQHWAWFRQDLAKPVGHAVVDAARGLAHGAADLGHDVASWI